jgi:hypothetical protein
MIASGMQVREGVSPEEVGAVVLDHLAKLLERGMAARDRAGVKVADSLYTDLLDDPVDCVGKIYDQFGLEFSSDAEQSLVRYLAENPKGKHGSHHYTLEEYGLSREQVLERLGTYVERFDLPTDA